MTITLIDIEGAMKTWLKTQTPVTALVATRVFMGVPLEATFPLVSVRRIGGGTQGGDAPIDDGLVQIDCWGNSKSQAWALTKAVVEALFAMSEQSLDGSTRGHGASGITWNFFPDPKTDRARYVITVSITASSQ